MPSTADRTEIAGVTSASPKNIAVPATASASSAGERRPSAPSVSAKRDRVPPSPWLSARSTSTTYFTVTTRMSAQKNRETSPMTAASDPPPEARCPSRKA